MITHAVISISIKEAVSGTRRIITRNGKRLEVKVPFGVRNGTIVRLRGARRITDGRDGDLLVRVNVKKPFPTGILVTAAVVAVMIVVTFLFAQAIERAEESKSIQATDDVEKTVEKVVETPVTIPTVDIADVDYITVFYNTQPSPDVISGAPVKLRNNNLAEDPTWQELYEFLMADMTDSNLYIPGVYECGHFAEDVHNNAEAAGIKAAWVAIWFVDELEGHAINAFNTVDKGLVYIDCQGLDISERLEIDLLEVNMDYVAYIVKGKSLGEIHIDEANSFDYSFYERYERLLIIWARQMGEDWYEELSHIVESVEIYW